MPDPAPCWASVSLGGMLLVRCGEQGEHVAHDGSVLTETRTGELRAGSVRKRHIVHWYDDGTVQIMEAASSAVSQRSEHNEDR